MKALNILLYYFVSIKSLLSTTLLFHLTRFTFIIDATEDSEKSSKHLPTPTSTSLDGVKSSLKPVLSGVPQGSILGPILFVLFINDLHEGISTDTHIALYADDTKLWRSIKNEEDITQLQRDINILYFWSLNNKMKFHPDKC